jgi:acyl-[acyl-carrier-protein]-phospholipid O-acyltransferase/long-chain-fatty-acid--[acyl-carrier-protein] ligase
MLQPSSTPIPFDSRRAQRSIMSALLEARKRFGRSRIVLQDFDDRQLSYDEIVRASFALGNALRCHAKPKEAIGIMLPTSASAILAFFAVQTCGRVPAMLNFTAGIRSVKRACAVASIKVIVTSREFLERAKLEHLLEHLSTVAEVICLEDLRANLSAIDRTAGIIGSFIPHWALRTWPDHDDAAVILFTSGTEGDPKGVVLSHANILANVEQVRAHLEIFPDTDVLFNPMPTFHCFGLTVGAILPLMVGVKTILYPSPLKVKEIAKRIRKAGATIVLSTDTFISQYARASDEGELASLRLAVCGAERVREETRQLLRRRCNIEILEGYGVTEAAAVVAANQPGANRFGTVGRMVAGMQYRLEPIEGIRDAGRLFVRGPNVMKGYLNPDRPGGVDAPPGGWHDTGDVASIDDAGYVTIRGRVKRFAKIGGEMVSLGIVENCASALWPDNMHAAVSVPDVRKGEQIVLMTDAKAADRTALLAWAQDHGVPELAIPHRIVHLDKIPILSTGKPDYAEITRVVSDILRPAKPL